MQTCLVKKELVLRPTHQLDCFQVHISVSRPKLNLFELAEAIEPPICPQLFDQSANISWAPLDSLVSWDVVEFLVCTGSTTGKVLQVEGKFHFFNCCIVNRDHAQNITSARFNLYLEMVLQKPLQNLEPPPPPQKKHNSADFIEFCWMRCSVSKFQHVSTSGCTDESPASTRTGTNSPIQRVSGFLGSRSCCTKCLRPRVYM